MKAWFPQFQIHESKITVVFQRQHG